MASNIIKNCVLLFLCILPVVNSVAQVGCYLEERRQRYFTVSPGDYDPATVTPAICASKCGSFQCSYAGLTYGKYCFCGNDLPPTDRNVSATYCDLECTGDATAKCGGINHVNVYMTSQPISGLSLTTTAVGSMVETGAPVTFEIYITTGSNLVYTMDYDDDAGNTAANVTDIETKVYYIPGEYSARVTAKDVGAIVTPAESVSAVLVQDRVSGVVIECPGGFATYEEGECRVTVDRGSNLKLSDYIDGTLNQNIDIADPLVSGTGIGVQSKGTQGVTGSGNGVYTIPFAEFKYKGKVLGWELWASVAGTIKIAILQPDCTDYCYTTNQCGACAGVSCSSTTFCPLAKACTDACSGVSRYPASSALNDYKVRQIVSVTVAQGYQYIQQTDDLLVEAGDILAYERTSGSGILTMESAQTTNDFFHSTGTLSPSSTFAKGDGAAETNKIHHLRAVYTGQSIAMITYNFTTPGNYSLKATVANTKLSQSENAETLIYVVEGINATEIRNDPFVATNEVAVFTIQPQTGSNIKYDYIFGDGVVVNGSDNATGIHVFTASGSYNVTICSWNVVSRKCSTTSIIIQDRLVGLQVTSNPSVTNAVTTFLFTLTSGEAYTCQWSYGDSETSTSNPTDTPVGTNTAYTHTYASGGNMTVNITCSNNINTLSVELVQVVQSEITNLRLENEGAGKNAPFTVVWFIDTGTDVAFTLVFDGASLAVGTADIVSKRWESEEHSGLPVGSYNLQLKAKNMINEQFINITFKVEVAMKDVEVTSTELRIGTSSSVNFTVHMDEGSNVVVTYEWGDGSADETLDIGATDWANRGPEVRSHVFVNSGSYNTKITVKNSATTIVKDYTVVAIASVFDVTMESEEFATYAPPGITHFTFRTGGTHPNEATVEFNFDDPADLTTHTYPLEIDKDYEYRYRDRLMYNMTAVIKNDVSSKTFQRKVTIVEPIKNMRIVTEPASAVKDEDLTVKVVMYRGPSGGRCTLRIDLDDGNSAIEQPRQGSGRDGTDAFTVRYTDMTTKTITVTAYTPLENVTVTYDVSIEVKVAPSTDVTTNHPQQFGNAIDYTVVYPGEPLPTNAFIKIDYGDGTNPFVGAFNSTTFPEAAGGSGGSHVWSYTPTQAGHYKATVTIWNNASNVTKYIWAGVYEDFEGLSCELNFKRAVPTNAAAKKGLDGSEIKFPRDEDIIFKVSLTKGTPVNYTMTSTANSQTVACNSETDEFSCSFKSVTSGTRPAIIKVENPMYSKSITKTIQIVDSVLNMSIEDLSTITKVNEKRSLKVTYEMQGTESCLHIDWSDAKETYASSASHCDPAFGGTYQSALTNPLIVEHAYPSTGFKTVGFTTSNSFSKEEKIVTFSISTANCTKPEVFIEDSATIFYQPTKISKSKLFILRGRSTITCGVSYSNTKSWEMDEISEIDGSIIGTINLDAIGIKHNLAELYISPKKLPYGLYRAKYTMEMTPDSGDGGRYVSHAYSYFRVEKSPIVAIMVKGGLSATKLTRGVSITLDPDKYSYDPDLDSSVPQGMANFQWSCEVRSNSSLSCPSTIVPTTSEEKWTIDTSTLTSNNDYAIMVVVSKDDRSAEASFLIKVVDEGPLPALGIECAGSSRCFYDKEGLTVSSKARLGLKCVCHDCDPSDTLTYEWKAYAYDYVWPWPWKPFIQRNFEAYVVGIQSEQISIQPELFQIQSDVKKYVFECNVWKNGANISGTSYAQVGMNDPPIPGSCSVTPTSRTAQWGPDKTFTISCTGWADSHGIVEYKYYTMHKDNYMEFQITKTNKDGTINVNLPLGSPYDDFKEDVYVKVMDSLEAVTTFKIATVTVSEMSSSLIKLETKKDIEDTMTKLDLIVAEGNQQTVCEAFSKIASLLNSESRRVQTEYKGIMVGGNLEPSQLGIGGEKRTGAFESFTVENEKELKRKAMKEADARAQIRGAAVEACSNVSTADFSAMEEVATCIATNAQFSTECSKKCQEMGSEKGLQMADQLSTMDFSFEQLETASLAILSVLTSTSNAAAFNMKHALLSEYEQDQTEPEFFILDTNMESTDYPINAWTLEEAEYQQTMLVHAKYQEAVAKRIAQNEARAREILNKAWAKTMIPGESYVQKSSTITMSYSNVKANSMTNMTFSAESQASSDPVSSGATLSFLGDNIDDLFTSNQVSGTDNVMIAIAKTNNHAGRYAKSSSVLGDTSSFVSISALSTTTGDEIPVKNTRKPLEIFIPRDENTPSLDFKENRPLVSPDNDFFVHKSEIQKDGSSVHIEFDLGDKSVQLLVVVRFGKFPKREVNGCDYIGTVPKVMAGGDLTDKFRYSFYLNNTAVNNFKGTVYIGIRQLKKEDQDKTFTDCATTPELGPPEDPARTFTTSYKTRIYATGCYFFDEANETWTTYGCVVGPKTEVQRTHCLCNHLTTFAGGWVVPPNTIDWDFVFSNADFNTNPTIYVTMIVVFVVYLLVAIWARRKDRKDIEKLGVTPLKDNDPIDKYYYEIIVSTGMRRSAATHSKVCLILSGEYDETDVRLLNDEKRKIFERGSVNTFLMACPQPLGSLNYARVWHDNSGKGNMGSWYLKYLLVKDIQTNDKFIFIADKWFAVEEGDGQVDRVIPVAGLEQMTNFSYMFSERSRKNLVDGHLWFSVLARPPQSRFTRLQRVSCCLCLLFTTMIANAMFYGIPQDGGGDSQTLSFGPFALSPTQIYIGVICNLIVFPVNFIIITLFRKARARKLRPSRITEALKAIPLSKSKTSASMTDVKPEVASIFQISRPSTVTGDPKRPETATSRPGTSMSTSGQQGETTVLKSKKKKKWELPWWFRHVGWVVLWLTTLASGAFIIFYGIMFGDDKTKKWITSLLISFITSVFLTQPIKVFLTAIVLSLIIKNPGEDEEDQPEDEEELKLNTDEEFLHTQEQGFGAARPRKIGYKPPDPEQLEKAREKRLNEIKMWKIIRELIFYSFFLWILMVISYRNRTPDSYLYKENMERMFILNNDTNYPFNKVKNTKDFWVWARSGLVSGIRASNFYNNYPPLLLRGFVNDKVSRIMGYATMRQLRIEPGLCKPSKAVRLVIDECNAVYSIFSEEKRSFLPGWEDLPSNMTVNDTSQPFIYRTASELNSYPYWGLLQLYGGGGYIYELRQNKSEMRRRMMELENVDWIDKYTRAVFIEFTVYNAQVNLFGIATILLEFQPSGGVLQSYRFEPAMLIPYMSSVVLFQIICEIVYLIFTISFIVIETRNFYKQRMEYFKDFWNWIEMSIIASSIGAVVIYFYRLIVVNKLTAEIKETHGNSYMKFQYAAYWSEMFTYMIGWLVFSATLKFLKLLRFNKRMSLLAGTLKHGARGIIHFSLIFWIIFFAFAQLFYLTFMASHHNFYNFVSSVEALVTMMMGKFDIYGMIMVQPILTQVYMFFFVLTVTFILVNMFMSILNETFTTVRSDINKRNNDYEIVDFMIGRFKKWTGIGTTAPTLTPEEVTKQKAEQYKKEPTVADFPDRIDRLLTTISNVYLDQEQIGPADTKMDMKKMMRWQYTDVRKAAAKK